MDAYKSRLAIAFDAALFYADMTPDQLAAKLGKHVESVRRWRRGVTRIDPEDLLPVAEALDCPVELLLRPPATRAEALSAISAHRDARRAR